MKKSYPSNSTKGIANNVTQKQARCSVSPITKHAIQSVVGSVKPNTKNESKDKGNES